MPSKESVMSSYVTKAIMDGAVRVASAVEPISRAEQAPCA